MTTYYVDKGDEDWRITPRRAYSVDDIPELSRDAAVEIARAWAQGTAMDAEGCKCLVAALSWAYTGNPFYPCDYQNAEVAADPVWHPLLDRVANVIDQLHGASPSPRLAREYGGLRPSLKRCLEFNDDVDTRRSDVLAVLDTIAWART